MDTSKINAKTTKAELLEIIKEQEALLKTKQALTDDPVREMKKVKEAKTLVSASEVVNSGIFSDEVVQKYNDVTEATRIKKAELQDLYGIETNADTLIALINAAKEKRVALEQDYAERKAELEKEYTERKAVLESEISVCLDEKAEIIDSIDSEAEIKKKQLENDRKREEEEYQYDLKRRRKIDADTWADEKKARLKELADKETLINENMKEMLDKTEYINSLETKVADIPSQLEEKFNEGFSKGKADADKSHVFEVRALKNQYEYSEKGYQFQVCRLKEEVANLKSANEVLQDKLDKAYAEMKELAATTVQSTGGVKILSSGEDKK